MEKSQTKATQGTNIKTIKIKEQLTLQTAVIGEQINK